MTGTKRDRSGQPQSCPPAEAPLLALVGEDWAPAARPDEGGYHTPSWNRRRNGEQRTGWLHVRCSDRERAQLDALAAAAGTYVSDIIRSAIRSLLTDADPARKGDNHGAF
jgi:hypothetical protein